MWNHLSYFTRIVVYLLCRAKTVVSEPEDVREEVNNIKKLSQ